MTETSKKKIKVVGTETFINSQTGELHEMQVVEVEERDAHFQKLWVSSILAAVEELSSQRLKIVFWLVSAAAPNRNVITKTTRELADEIGVSRTTLIDTLQVLEKYDIIRRKTGVIFMSPEVVYKGSLKGRMEVLTRYRQIPKESHRPTKEEHLENLLGRAALLQRELDNIMMTVQEIQTEDQTAAAE